ncbi:hypothetical protein [Sphingomonas aquatilis]
MLDVILIRIEMLAYTALAMWMGWAVWKSSRGDKRYGDTARLVILSFSLLLIYRDWRILFADDSPEAKIVMAVLGISLAAFTALAAKAYGRGRRLS